MQKFGISSKSSFRRSWRVQSLIWLSGLGVCFGGGAIAQEAPLSEEVPSAIEPAPPERSAAPSESEAVQVVPVQPGKVTPLRRRNALAVPAADLPPLPASSPELTSTEPRTGLNYSDLYIDTTDYNIGATQGGDSPTVVLSERSTGCQSTFSDGENIANQCVLNQPNRSTSRSVQAGNTLNLGLIRINERGVEVNLPSTLSSVEAFYNRSIRPSQQMGNGNTRLMFPVTAPAMITSVFGWRLHPIFGNYRFHSGTDIAAPQGTPVAAALSGKVVLANFVRGYGLTIKLEHDNGTQQTWYAHLSEIFVRPGETIQQGAVIGRVGMTGTATGPNLHFELRQNTETGWVAVNSYVTPGNLLGQASSSSQSPSSGRSSSSAARISNIQHFGLLAGTVERSQNQTD